MGNKLEAFRLTARVAQTRIRELASADSNNVIFGHHALERMEERDISTNDALLVLQSGHIADEPELTEYGEWKCKMTKPIRGGREAGVVTVIMHNGKLFIKTVEWEDLR